APYCCPLRRRSPTREATPSRRSNSASMSRSAGSGAKRSIGGKRLSSSIRPTRPPTTTWRLRTSTRDSSIKRGKPTRRRSNSVPTTPRSGRTTSSSRKSMIGPVPAKKNNGGAPWHLLALAAGAALVATLAAACGASYLEIPIETPIQPKLDVSAFQRVLVAGFVAGGTDDIDANQETVRLLRSQLRTKSTLKVIDADILPLIEVAQEPTRAAD